MWFGWESRVQAEKAVQQDWVSLKFSWTYDMRLSSRTITLDFSWYIFSSRCNQLLSSGGKGRRVTFMASGQHTGLQDLFTCSGCSLSRLGLSASQRPEVSDFVTKEQRAHGREQEEEAEWEAGCKGAINAKWEWKGWKPINENQYKKAGRHKNWGGKVIE